MTEDPGAQTELVQNWVQKLQAGDDSAREELINCACDRLLRLTRSIKRSFDRVNRWEQTEDVFQRATMRLYQSLQDVKLNDARHFYRLAALQIRRELIDLARHYNGPQEWARTTRLKWSNRMPVRSITRPTMQPDQTGNPEAAIEWGEFHTTIEKLPEEQKEVVELLFYHGLSQEEAAKIMDVSVRTVKRYWRAARMALHEHMEGDFPDLD